MVAANLANLTAGRPSQTAPIGAVSQDDAAELLNVSRRNRVVACQQAGIEIDTKVYDGDDPTGFAISLNLHRRHLSESQRAMVAANMANLERGDNRFTIDGAIEPSISQDDAADMLNVGRESVKRAAKVRRDGVRSDRSQGAPIGAPISQDDAAELLNVSRRNVQRAAIGRTIGVHHKTVMRDLSTVSNETVEAVTGVNGKTYSPTRTNRRWGAVVGSCAYTDLNNRVDPTSGNSPGPDHKKAGSHGHP